VNEPAWPRRSWALALLGAAVGFLVYRVLPLASFFEPSAAELVVGFNYDNGGALSG
jgi:hypothetical protein